MSALVVSLVVPLGIASVASADVTTPGPASMDAGGIHTCVVTSGGGLKCWGYNFYGELGDGTRTSRPDAQFVPGLESGVKAVSAAGQSTCAVTTAGGVKCWGTNRFGELGDGTHTDRLSPVDVVGLSSGVIAVAASYFHTCALLSTGGVKCWGSNASGELGIGSSGGDRTTPVDVVGLTSGVVGIAGGDDDGNAEQTCALTSVGGVKCWGSNAYGQLGDGTTTSRSTPVDVAGLTSGVASISAGGGVSCAVTVAGAAKCWGLNEHGQIGDGTTTSRSTPVTVAGSSSGIAQIAISQSSQHLSHLCATTTSGAVRCWGYNANSQVGNGSFGPDVLTPAPVVGLSSGYVGVATSFYHSCALSSAGAVKCWGANQYDEIGDGTTIGRVTPVDISGSFFRPECPNLIAEDHTGFTLGDGYAVGSRATFTADPGFDLAGSATTTCRTDLTWSDPPPGVVPPSAVPRVLAGAASATEGDTGTTPVQVPVTLSVATTATVSVQWTTLYASGAPGSQADPASDYTPASGTVTFEPGETTETVTVEIAGDTLVEPDEYVVVSFHDPTDAVMGGFWGLGFGVITNDDHAAVLAGVATAVEGDAGTTTLEVPVTLSTPSTETVTVRWNTLYASGAPGDQADGTTDYVPVSGTVTFAPGETTKTVAVIVNSDTLVEPDEYVVVSFHDPTNAVMGGFWGLGFGVITNDD